MRRRLFVLDQKILSCSYDKEKEGEGGKGGGGGGRRGIGGGKLFTCINTSNPDNNSTMLDDYPHFGSEETRS